MGMLTTCKYEKTLLQTTNAILDGDLFWALRTRHKAKARGLSSSVACHVCRQAIVGSTASFQGALVVFQGRAAHARCMDSVRHRRSDEPDSAMNSNVALSIRDALDVEARDMRKADGSDKSSQFAYDKFHALNVSKIWSFEKKREK